MQVSRMNSVNFNGEIIPHNMFLGESFDTKVKTSPALKAIADNIKEEVHVYLKHRHASTQEIYRDQRDEDLYRVIIKLKRPVRTTFDKIINFLFADTIPLTGKFHSESTTLSLLSNSDHINNLFKKYIKYIKK